ncbi:MAG: hypothetical protein Q9190_006978 [Brigantiaea leucoxantha]
MDDEDYYDEDDDFYIEDPYAEADDLAEHTMQSPVWLNYDPDIDIDECWSDWDYYSDDFYDDEALKSKRQEISHVQPGSQAAGERASKSKIRPTDKISELSSGEAYDYTRRRSIQQRPIVRWKSRSTSPQLPVLDKNEGETVTLLKDWKERFKIQPSLAARRALRRSEGQRAFAVVIEQRDLDDKSEYDLELLPVEKSSRFQEAPSASHEPSSKNTSAPASTSVKHSTTISSAKGRRAAISVAREKTKKTAADAPSATTNSRTNLKEVKTMSSTKKSHLPPNKSSSTNKNLPLMKAKTTPNRKRKADHHIEEDPQAQGASKRHKPGPPAPPPPNPKPSKRTDQHSGEVDNTTNRKKPGRPKAQTHSGVNETRLEKTPKGRSTNAATTTRRSTRKK